MIFILLNEGTLNLNNRFFFLFDHLKILSKDNMKRNFVQKPRCPHQIGNKKKYKSWDKSFILFLKSDH